MELDDVSEDDPLLASLDIILLKVQKDITRNTVLASTVVMFQGLTLLFLAWLADGFIITLVTGLVGGIVFILSLLVTFINFKAHLKMFMNLQKAQENFSAADAHPAMQEHPAFTDSEDDESS